MCKELCVIVTTPLLPCKDRAGSRRLIPEQRGRKRQPPRLKSGAAESQGARGGVSGVRGVAQRGLPMRRLSRRNWAKLRQILEDMKVMNCFL